MNFEDKKFTRDEIIHALRLCANGGPCEQCEFYEAETPRGYSPCHEYMMLEQAADLLEERTAKVESITLSTNPRNEVYKCSKCGQYFHRTLWSVPVRYCPSCGSRLEWG